MSFLKNATNEIRFETLFHCIPTSLTKFFLSSYVHSFHVKVVDLVDMLLQLRQDNLDSKLLGE
jgi:hypothetical protein